jgi:hypothetical protein
LRGSGRLVLCLVFLLTVIPSRPLPAAPADQGRKYAVIAAFLYNFLLYVDWPEEAADGNGPLRIGVLGANPFGGALTAMEKKTVAGRAIEIAVHDTVATLEPCHILFIPGDHDDQLAAARRALRDKPVLTVGESTDFTRLGGVARFFPQEDTARLGVEINQTAADACPVKIRAKLMRLASVVSHPLPALDP